MGEAERITITDLTDKMDSVTLDSLRSLVLKILNKEADAYSNVNVVVTDDAHLRDLNHEWRSNDEPTDVLSFSLRDDDNSPVEGDIYISVNRARIQAVQAGHEFEHELFHLTAHGVLHLCGWEHEDDQALNAMIAKGMEYIDTVLQGMRIGS